ncbi:MAG TPA: hypothetical protein VHS78_13635 [Candidatus Elarobacter sp.]|nr:hypothetical protein [Candidatus Elarobacter sp.]
MTCCRYEDFQLLEELGHAESVDWDLGTCKRCGSFLLRQWSEHAPASIFVDRLTTEEGTAFRESRGRARIMLLKRWYADH